jgi:hypothetical protein
VARHRCGRLISYVQVSNAAFDQGRWVTIGLGSAEAADQRATDMLAHAATAEGTVVRVIAEGDLSAADVGRAHADLRSQANG